MEFLKKHYEKLILSLVLLALAVVAVLLFVQVGSFKESLESQLNTRTTGKHKELAPADLNTNLLKQLRSTVQVPLGTPRPTFNGPRWRRAANGDAVPDTTRSDQGPAGISALTTMPLYLSVEFAKTVGTTEAPRYEFLIGREFEKAVNKRGNLTLSARAGEGVRLPSQKTDLFRLAEVKGAPAEPTELVIQLTEGNERASVIPHKPFRRVMGYSAAFTYGSEKRSFKNVRVDDSLPLSGVTYKVVAITENELVLSAPNKVRTNIKAMPNQ
jgi:hypothetical protein